MSGALIASYATKGLRLWAEGNTGHGRECPCLICCDTRRYLGMPPLRGLKPETAERRAAS